MISKEQAEINKKIETQLNGLTTELRTKQGIQGPRGPSGPQGPPGLPSAGNFNFQGVFRNADPSVSPLVMDRTLNQNGTTNSRVWLNTPESSTNQFWTLQQGGQMRNQWGQCLSANKDNQGNYNVFMTECKDNETEQKWYYDNLGRMQWQGGDDTCLTYTEETKWPTGATNPISMGFAIAPEKRDKYYMVSIGNCGSEGLSGNQSRPKDFSKKMQWSFIGHLYN